MRYLKQILAWGGIKRELAFLIISGIALAASIAGFPALPFDAAWVAIILCGVPIILEAVIGLVTSFDIKADVLVSLALMLSAVERLFSLDLLLPVPGLRLGLPNIVTLFALWALPAKTALLILVLRCVLASLFGGGASALIFSLSGTFL